MISPLKIVGESRDLYLLDSKDQPNLRITDTITGHSIEMYLSESDLDLIRCFINDVNRDNGSMTKKQLVQHELLKVLFQAQEELNDLVEDLENFVNSDEEIDFTYDRPYYIQEPMNRASKIWDKLLWGKFED